MHRAASLVVFAVIATVFAIPAHAQSLFKSEGETKVNLGTITDEQSHLHAFKFTNISARRAKLAMAYCHFCAAPILDKNVLQPGESATVVLELDPANRRGPYTASVTVAEEGRPDTRIDFELKAEIVPRIWVEPTNMFPRIVRGRGASGSFSVTGRTKEFKVIRVESDAPLDGYDIAPRTEFEEFGAPAYKQEITIRFPRDVPIGPYSANLRIVTNDETIQPRMVSASGQVVGQIDHDPAVVRFEAKPAEPFQTTFDLTSAEGPVILHSLDITDRDECTSVVLDASPTADPSRIRITVTGIAPIRERQLVAVNVRARASTLTMPGEEPHDIPVMMVVRPQPR